LRASFCVTQIKPLLKPHLPRALLYAAHEPGLLALALLFSNSAVPIANSRSI